MKAYGENKELSFFKFWDVNNLYSLEMLQQLPVSNFEWMDLPSQFNENFIKKI